MRKMTLTGLCLVVAASCWLAGTLVGPDGLRSALASLGACAAFAGAAACYRVVQRTTHRGTAAGALALLGVAASACIVEATFRATYPRLPGASADPVTLTALVAGGTGLALLIAAVWRAGRLGPTAGSLLVAAALIGAVTGRPAVPYLISAGPLGLALLVGRAPQPVRRPAAFAYAAGITGTLANLLLIAFFAVQFGDPEQPVSFGTANDLVGSLASALMIPVAVALSSHLPVTAAARRAQTAGVAAMAASAVVGPLLVTGALPFEVSTAISIGALLVLAGWLVAVSRWLRRSHAVPARVARLGELSGLAFATGAAVVALGVPLPWMSVHQLVIFGVGAGVGSAAFLAIPIWFLLLARHFPADTPVPAFAKSPGPIATEVTP
jgi:hypothetical protein